MAQKQTQVLVGPFDDVDIEIAQERNREIKQIEQDTQDLAESFALLNKQVANQGDQIDHVETLMDKATDDSWDSVANLKQAEARENTRRKWLAGAMITGGVIVTGLVGLLVAKRPNIN
jgi:t-SNARE complex subunit (syntaxin)